MGIAVFAAGFILLWSLGSWLVGGGGFPGGSDVGSGVSAVVTPVALPVQADYTLQPLVDLRAFRDLSYVPVKGVYLTSYGAASTTRLNEMIGLADRTEINAFVIDVKDDIGLVTYDAAVPFAKELGLVDPRIDDIDALIAKLRQHGITPIARLVCFKDNTLATKRPDLAVKSSKGGLWKDYKGLSYINPYKHEAWEYLVEVAEDVARHGFREIQFDYVRFPSDGPISQAVYPGEYSSKEDCIAGFLAFAHQRLEKLGVWVSADVFGITVSTSSAKDSATIGQNIEKISQNVDIVCPMVYPSHYTANYYGVANPNAHPYEIVTAAMKDTKKRLAGTGAMGRPWLQDFSLGGVTYGVAEVKAQIKAAEEQGFSEWILWDPSLKYSEGALRAQTN
jgi:hypothetical protein